MRVLVTGAAGLIGAEACRQYAARGDQVIGIDNDLRSYFFGEEASTAANYRRLFGEIGGDESKHRFYTTIDIRSQQAIERVLMEHRPHTIIHCAAQPSHDWAAREPHVDFDVNARGTLNLLQAARVHCPTSPFIHCSTSKVYGDRPNSLPLHKARQRLDLEPNHPYFYGIDTTMSVDLCTHSLFGVSKLAGDLMVQEYGRYFNMPTVCFRPGCLTGGGHAGTELHGFLSYLMRCAVSERPYTIYGYDGLQVRCNIHSSDLVRAFREFEANPRAGAVYNIGGGRQNSISMLEAIDMCETIAGKKMDIRYDPTPRVGDHRWWISSNAAFEKDYPHWRQQYDLAGMLQEIHDSNVVRWSAEKS